MGLEDSNNQIDFAVLQESSIINLNPVVYVVMLAVFKENFFTSIPFSGNFA